MFKEKCELCGKELLYDSLLKGHMYTKYGWQFFTGKWGMGGEPTMIKLCSSCDGRIQNVMDKIKKEHQEKDPFKEAFKDGK